MASKIIALSGLSGVGKTTAGKYVADKLGFTFIDQDTFFKDVKPKVVLSDGTVASNWDCLEAIDWDKFNEHVQETLKTNNIVLVGFCLRKEMLKFTINLHILLEYKDDPIEMCINARKKSKSAGSKYDSEKDALMVREVVYPFYKETCLHLSEDVQMTASRPEFIFYFLQAYF